jgi:hypothetical protein
VRGVSETEGELNKLAQSVQPEPDPHPDAPPPAAAPGSPQGELPLESSPQPPAQKQA